MLQKIEALRKGEGKGRSIGIFTVKRPLHFEVKEKVKLPTLQEVLNLRKYLKEYVLYDEVYIINFYFDDRYYFRKKEKFPYLLNIKNLEEVKNLVDDLLYKPDTLTVFGGIFPQTIFYISSFIYDKMKDDRFRIYFYDHDPECLYFNPIRDIGRNLWLNWKPKDLDKMDKDIIERYNLTSEDVMNYLDNNMISLYDGIDYEKVIEMRKSISSDSDYSKIKRWSEFKINEFSFSNSFDLNKILVNNIFKNKKYKFSYFGGNRRDKKRREIINDLLSNIDSSLIIGNIYDGLKMKDKGERFDYMGYMKIPELYYYLSENVKSSLFLIDELNWNRFKSFRFFENLLLDYVGFIYYQCDSDRKFIKNEELRDFIYIYSKEDFEEKVNRISSDENLYRRLIYLERKEFFEECKEYFSEENRDIFLKYLKDNEL